MAIHPAPVIAGAAALLALLYASDSKAASRPPLGPMPVPQSDEDLLLIDRTICDCWESLGRPSEFEKLLYCAADTLHPGVPFPPIPEDHATVRDLWELFRSRTQAFLQAADKDSWCAGLEGGFDPLELFEELLSSSPTPNSFYLVGSDPEMRGDDNFNSIVRRALNTVVEGAGNEGANRVDYMRCITSGPQWNWRYYASPSFSDKFPSYTGVNGMGLRRAFFPWHPDAREAIGRRQLPKRAITTNGAKIPGMGDSYGLLWLPPVDADILARENTVTCANVEWSDGSSSIDPPSELLNALREV